MHMCVILHFEDSFPGCTGKQLLCQFLVGHPLWYGDPLTRLAGDLTRVKHGYNIRSTCNLRYSRKALDQLWLPGTTQFLAGFS